MLEITEKSMKIKHNPVKTEAEGELMRQFPEIEDPTHVFYAQPKTTKANE